jgi:hypothetical protein
VARTAVPPEQRFAKKYRVDTKTGCWVWTTALMANGYAQFRWSKSKNGYGHRFAYEHFVGPIPEERVLHHTCGNKACVNPDHLQVVTQREHVLELTKGEAAKNALKTHCKRGHPLSGDNLAVYRGHRRCLTCEEIWRDEHREEQREYNRRYYQEHRDVLAPRRLKNYYEHKETK